MGGADATALTLREWVVSHSECNSRNIVDLVDEFEARNAPNLADRVGRMSAARLLLLAGCACLVAVVLTHVAEAMHWLPGMGWGMPDSPGHYLDLFSAIAGVALLVAAIVVRLLRSK